MYVMVNATKKSKRAQRCNSIQTHRTLADRFTVCKLPSSVYYSIMGEKFMYTISVCVK